MPQQKIIVADDSRAFRASARQTLDGAGYDVTLASDGIEALQFARRDQPDLIILDIHMPVMDGYAVCDEILAEGGRLSSVPIIFVTCDNAKHLQILGADLGAHLIKPVSGAQLLSTVERLLGGKDDGQACPELHEVAGTRG